MGFNNVADYSYKHYNVKNVSDVTTWIVFFQQEAVEIKDYSSILKLVELFCICYIYPPQIAENENQGSSGPTGAIKNRRLKRFVQKKLFNLTSN